MALYVKSYYLWMIYKLNIFYLEKMIFKSASEWQLSCDILLIYFCNFIIKIFLSGFIFLLLKLSESLLWYHKFEIQKKTFVSQTAKTTLSIFIKKTTLKEMGFKDVWKIEVLMHGRIPSQALPSKHFSACWAMGGNSRALLILLRSFH